MSQATPITTCREMLDVLDAFLVRNNTEARRCWNILTALRSPDVEKNAGLKASHTNVIRSAAFPLCAASATRTSGFAVGASFAPPRTPLPDPAGLRDKGPGHDIYHIRSALEALRGMAGVAVQQPATPLAPIADRARVTIAETLL